MKPTINLKFDTFDADKSLTMRDIVHTSRGGISNNMMEEQKGFRFSQVIEGMIYYYELNPDADDTMILEHCSSSTKPYIIPTAVQYSPFDWADVDIYGNPDPTKKSIFELINPTYLRDLQNGDAILLIDQSVEGYSAKWLWQWFHNKCEKYNIDPAAIIYLSGDQFGVDSYDIWCKTHLPDSRLKFIPSISLTTYLHKHYVKRNMNINFDDILDYKSKNKDNLYLFDCTNMRPRAHRILNFLHMLNAGLLEKGNISMSSQGDWKPFFDMTDTKCLTANGLPADIISKLTPEMTPLSIKHNYDHELSHYYHYVERILDDMYRNSWVSLISESSYFEYEHSAFLSEKTFKPIASMQPFMILGSRDILKYLHRLGFKTFEPYIDESYALENDGNRFQAIMNTIKKIEEIKDKVEWYASMRDVLEHNHSLFIEIGSKKSTEHIEIFNYYFEYFKGKNV